MQLEHRCQECSDLEQGHDQAMDELVNMVNQQSRLFRLGQASAGRALDSAIQRMKVQREAAIDALLRHQANHYEMRVSPQSASRSSRG